MHSRSEKFLELLVSLSNYLLTFTALHAEFKENFSGAFGLKSPLLPLIYSISLPMARGQIINFLLLYSAHPHIVLCLSFHLINYF